MTITVANANSPDFPEAFTVTVATPPPADEQDYAVALKGQMDFFATLGVVAGTNPSSALARALRTARSDIVGDLRAEADAVAGGGMTATQAMQNVFHARGEFDTEYGRLTALQFTVERVPLVGDATDVKIIVESGLADDTIAPDKQKLFVDITNAQTVVTACCDRMPDRPRADKLRSEFIDKLAGCARVGLNGTHPDLAQSALATIKGEFFSRNAGAIKKRANEALAVWAFGIAAAFLVAYFVSRWMFYGLPPEQLKQGFIYVRKEFFLIAAGAAIGTWLSFSIRNLDLTFDDLGKFEDEFLAPWVRVTFVVVLATIVGLMFWSNAFSMKIGSVNIAHSVNGATALLIGLFCGLSERALATAVSSRAGAFVRAVGGP